MLPRERIERAPAPRGRLQRAVDVRRSQNEGAHAVLDLALGDMSHDIGKSRESSAYSRTQCSAGVLTAVVSPPSMSL